MSISRTHEAERLSCARLILEKQLRSISGKIDESARFEILEAAASEFGGFRLTSYRSQFNAGHCLSESRARSLCRPLVDAIRALPIHSAMVLSALATPTLEHSEKRSSGVYHTDYRLAGHLAGSIGRCLNAGARVIDPACGSGILLVAATIEALNRSKVQAERWLASSIYAADLSELALRGTRLALASFTDDIDVIAEMSSHWVCADSLLVGAKPFEAEFDVVVANPPWEKIKATRHEFLQSNGVVRHYGADYESLDNNSFRNHRSERVSYSQQLIERFPTMRRGEPDLYKPFLELSLRLCKRGGHVAILVPAGLIRSQGTESLRRLLFDTCNEVELTVFENRARFFAIDSRFKFLSLSAERAKTDSVNATLKVSHGIGDDAGVTVNSDVHITIAELANMRHDLSVPEVKTREEWNLFRSFALSGVEWSDSGSEWFPEIVREVDMTRDRQNFQSAPLHGALPLIEGRMIHQHRFGCKGYRSGTGRRALWEALPLGSSTVEPQFWFPVSAMTPSVRHRSQQLRAGFCDITGQTNERSMLAAMVPPGVVCGNKVPTVTFVNDPNLDRLDLWIGIVNSLPFDWLIRRVITTTINYFLLLSVPLPDIKPKSQLGKKIVKCSRELRAIDAAGCPPNFWKVAELRAEIDVAVLRAYGGSAAEMGVILDDFRLLDRSQPPLDKEDRSTITRDLILSVIQPSVSHHKRRVDEARGKGACAYIPAQYINKTNDDLADICYA